MKIQSTNQPTNQSASQSVSQIIYTKQIHPPTPTPPIHLPTCSIRSTDQSNVSAVVYFLNQVYAKGALVLAKTETRRNRRTRNAFSFPLTSAMAPICDVIVFFQTESGEVVADRLTVRVDDASANKVTELS